MGIFLDFVQVGVAEDQFSTQTANFVADKTKKLFDKLKDIMCGIKSELCQKIMPITGTRDDIMGLCNAKPLTTDYSKCLVECQMRRYKWVYTKSFKKIKLQ